MCVEVKEKVISIIARTIGSDIAELNEDTRLDSLKIDSIEYVSMIVDIETCFGFEFLPEDLNFDRFEAIGDLERYVIMNI